MSGTTAGELRRALQGLDDSDEISIAGGLSFYRLKYVDEGAHFLEFNEPEGYKSDEFKKRNPSVQVVFLNPDAAEWDEDGGSAKWMCFARLSKQKDLSRTARFLRF